MKQPRDDGLEWFGEGFDGFPKRFPDDTVEYLICIIDPKLEQPEVRDRLRKIQNAATGLTKRLLKDFIWQREAFGLELVREKGTSFLRGQTNYGDSVEDEWLIVYLLRELSKQFVEAWIKVTDTDGEFLLIEAANALPKWLNPEIADNRVWLNNAELLVIPPSKSPASPSTSPPPLPSALHTLATTPRSALLHARLIEEEAFYRLRHYPAQIRANLHHALITVPRRVAFILHADPAYISPATEAFYLRDRVALRPLQDRVSASAPETPTRGSSVGSDTLLFPPEDFVTALVRFTKVGYAQLKSQVFPAPGRWKEAVAPNAGGTVRQRQELGMKVSCGLEMLVRDPQNVDKKVVREIRLLLEDLERGEEKLPGDQEVREWGVEEDDEGWLDIGFEDLERELKGGRGKGERVGGDEGGEFGDKKAQEDLRKMVERFEDFMNEDEVEDMDEDDDEESDSDLSSIEKEKGDGAEDKDASFDEDEFTAMMREMMGMPKEVMEEIMGPKAAKARGVARDDGATDPKVLEMEEKPTFGPERPPHMQAANGDKDLKPSGESEVAKGKRPAKEMISNEEDVDEIPRGDDLDSEDDEAQIRELTEAFEVELKKAGALSLDDPNETRIRAKKIPDKKSAATATSGVGSEGEDEGSEGEMLDDNYNLVSNMLESFKSQAGMSGPGSNMLGMMGMKLPRDEDDGEKKGGSSRQGSKRP